MVMFCAVGYGGMCCGVLWHALFGVMVCTVECDICCLV